MTIKKKKISEFPLAESLKGFSTIGYQGAYKQTVRADLGFVEEAAEKAAVSIAETKAVTSKANAAAAIANQAAGNADAVRLSIQNALAAKQNKLTPDAGIEINGDIIKMESMRPISNNDYPLYGIVFNETWFMGSADGSEMVIENWNRSLSDEQNLERIWDQGMRLTDDKIMLRTAGGKESVSFWEGAKTEYDAIIQKASSTFYFVEGIGVYLGDKPISTVDIMRPVRDDYDIYSGIVLYDKWSLGTLDGDQILFGPWDASLPDIENIGNIFLSDNYLDSKHIIFDGDSFNPNMSFWQGTKAEYNSIATKSTKSYYFVEDTGIYRGTNIVATAYKSSDDTAGRRWNESMGTPVGEAYGNIDMLRELPTLLGLGCYLVTDDRNRRKLDPTNHYKFLDGTTAALDGSMGQYMWCWNAHYYACWTEYGYFYEAVSLSPFPDKESYYIPAGGTSAFGNGVVDRDNAMLCSVINDSPRYRGGANQAEWDNTYRSMLGLPVSAIGELNFGAFSTYARKRGQGWEANWYVSRAVQEYLFRIIMGTRNSQSNFNPDKDANGLYQGGLDIGLTDITGASWSEQNGYYPMVPTSAGVELGDSCGIANYNILKEDGSIRLIAKIPVFLGLKNLYGNLWSVVSGLIMNSTADKTDIYVARSLYDGWSQSNITGMVYAGEMLARDNGYIKKISMNKLCCLPTELGATSETYFSDYNWSNHITSFGLRCRICSGASDNNTGAGAFCSRSSVSFTSTGSFCSAPLCYFEEDPIMR